MKNNLEEDECCIVQEMVASLRFMPENCKYKAVFKVFASCPGGPFFVFFFLFGVSSQLSKLRMSGLVFLCGEKPQTGIFLPTKRKRLPLRKTLQGCTAAFQ